MSPDLQWITSFAGTYPALDILAIFFAEYVGYLMLIIVGITVLLEKDIRRRMYIIFFSGLSVVLASGIIKGALNYFLYRPRPFVAYNITPLVEQAATASFPSGHATLFFTIATIIFMCLSRRWGMWAYGIATLIGIARIYAGVHFPLDIVGGAAVGIISPFIVRWLLPPRIAIAVAPKANEDAASA